MDAPVPRDASARKSGDMTSAAGATRAMSECRALGVIDNLIDPGRAIEMRPL
jgi:hypothetical protein